MFNCCADEFKPKIKYSVTEKKSPTIFLFSALQDVIMYLPKDAKRSVPVFLGFNFKGNATIQADPHIILSDKPVYPHFEKPNDNVSRGTESSR